MLLADAVLGIRERIGRVVLTSLGTVLGVASLVAILGVTETARVHVSARFDAYRATQVTITDRRHPSADTAFAGDVDQAIAQLPGVVSGGLLWTVGSRLPVRSTSVITTPATRTVRLPVIAATAGGLLATGPRFAGGRFDGAWWSHPARVALVGAAAAAELRLPELVQQPSIAVDGVPFTVVGVLGDSDRRPETLMAVIVPATTATALWGGPADAESEPMALIEVQPGAAAVVGRQAPYALHPQQPDRLGVSLPPEMAELRERVDADLGRLVLLLAGVCLALGIVGIANSSLVAVLERVAEIGLRKALGARPRHIAALVFAESVAVGSLASLAGAWLGVWAVVGVSFAQQWRPMISPVLLLAAPLLGGVTGVVAGLYPAICATRLEAVEALRR
jgi:putative ABC transport system permease protein